jgi:glycine/D-amino acid oxidase-like deaminating enzyme
MAAHSHSLSNLQVHRYGRQMLVPQLGAAGQERLTRAAVLVVGAGGLGSPALLYLAAAGVGRLGVVDHDEVDLSNLHRQVTPSARTLSSPPGSSLLSVAGPTRLSRLFHRRCCTVRRRWAHPRQSRRRRRAWRSTRPSLSCRTGSASHRCRTSSCVPLCFERPVCAE